MDLSRSTVPERFFGVLTAHAKERHTLSQAQPTATELPERMTIDKSPIPHILHGKVAETRHEHSYGVMQSTQPWRFPVHLATCVRALKHNLMSDSRPKV